MKTLLAQIGRELPQFEGIGPLGLEGRRAETAPGLFNQVISAIIGILTVIAGVYFVFIFITGGIQYITSGGDKAATEAARGRITNGVIGLVIVVVAIFIIDILGDILGIDILNPAQFIIGPLIR